MPDIRLLSPPPPHTKHNIQQKLETVVVPGFLLYLKEDNSYAGRTVERAGALDIRNDS